ncbi:MAG: ERF family protein [Xenococcaceae cyanobacterium MO_207.B15]|nr:ERF family protein [Xenococcaceae cyanobacterium MO_207.B15]
MKKELFKKLLKVQQNLKPISETGKNKYQGYKYATAVDVIEPVKATCNQFGLFIYLDVIESNIEPGRASCKICLTVVDSDTGESIDITSVGYAEDWSHKENRPTGDKAIYKAITGATKYAIRSMFVLPSTDDPEVSQQSPQQSTSSSNYSYPPTKTKARVMNESNPGYTVKKKATSTSNPQMSSQTKQNQVTAEKKADKPYKNWKTDDDALGWAIDQLPTMPMNQLTQEWENIKPISLPNGKTSKAVAWVNRVKALKAAPEAV